MSALSPNTTIHADRTCRWVKDTHLYTRYLRAYESKLRPGSGNLCTLNRRQRPAAATVALIFCHRLRKHSSDMHCVIHFKDAIMSNRSDVYAIENKIRIGPWWPHLISSKHHETAWVVWKWGNGKRKTKQTEPVDVGAETCIDAWNNWSMSPDHSTIIRDNVRYWTALAGDCTQLKKLIIHDVAVKLRAEDS